MIEHNLIDLFVAYSMKRNYKDIQMDIFYGLLFSNLLFVSFLLFAINIPISWDSIALLFSSLYICDATIFGHAISFSYNFSSACRLFFIGLCILIFINIRLLNYFRVFHFVSYFIKNIYNFLSRIIFKYNN